RPHAEQLRDLPLPARLVLRAAARRADRGLAARGRALLVGANLPRARVPGRADLRLVRRLRALPVALAARTEVVDRPRGAPASRADRLHGIAAELRRGLPPLCVRRTRRAVGRRQTSSPVAYMTRMPARKPQTTHPEASPPGARRAR